MKTLGWLLLLALSLVSCWVEPPGQGLPDALNEAPAPCPFPVYVPPLVTPGTGCRNPCRFVYEGWVDFEAEVLEANCRRLPLSSPGLSFGIDSTLIRHVSRGFLKVLRIQAAGIGPWCLDEAFFRVEGCPEPERIFLFVSPDGLSEYRVVWPPGFWGCATGKPVFFRAVAQMPLRLGG